MEEVVQGKSIVVTGARGNLGTVLAKTLAGQGAQVIGVDLAPMTEGAPFAMALGGVDLGDPAAVAKAFDAIKAKFGKIEGLANIAGGFVWETVEGGAIETWDRMFAMNVRSAFLTCQAALPLLKASGNGAVVNVSAYGSVRADTGFGAYGASKAGVSKLTEALAAETKDAGVRVNAVLPSIIDTKINRDDMPNADFTRWVTPEALSDVVAFLLSDASRAVTGALLPVLGRV
jgi:NAD(P)-dependent dehydrogenase (short-subunit alcohol dehydrogenase family)